MVKIKKVKPTFALSKTEKLLKQSGKIIDKERDLSRVAQLPGKRVSRTGNVYWETRKNRSDALGSNL